MSSEVGDQALRVLREKGPKRQKGPQNVCKNSKLPKKTAQCQSKGPILEISAAPRSLPRDKIYGTRGDRSPRFIPVSPALAKPPVPPVQCSWYTRHYVRHSVLPFSVACLTSLSRSYFIVYFLNIYNIVSLHLQPWLHRGVPRILLEGLQHLEDTR